jgi:hypothetical protein
MNGRVASHLTPKLKAGALPLVDSDEFLPFDLKMWKKT